MQSHEQTRHSQPKPRLRDSCTNCARSKLKCSKGKPTCKRCETRGLSCYYSPSQRAGRTSSAHVAAAPARQPPSTALHKTYHSATPSVPPAPPPAPAPAPPPLPPPLPYSVPNTTTSRRDQAHDTPISKSPTSLTSVLSPFQSLESLNTSVDGFGSDSGAPSLFGGDETTDFDTAMSASMDFTMMGNFDFGSMFPSQNDPSPCPSTGFDPITADQANSALPTPPLPSPFSLQDSDSLEPSKLNDRKDSFPDRISPPVRPHNCLTVALNILPTLQSDPSTRCTHSSSNTASLDQHNPPAIPTIDTVIANNKATIEAITTMLACPCSLDEHMAAIISLIAFKVMAWYAAAARDTPQPGSGASTSSRGSGYHTPTSSEQVLHVPITVGKYHLDGADQSRIRAQLVLSELHRVQRLIEVLSKRLEVVRQRTVTASSADGSGTTDDTMSASIFVQLESDLRRRLRAVSKGTMDILRRW